MTPTFQGEIQFRRWSDSSTQGVQVTFALPDASELEPLKTKVGRRFMAVLVELGDDELPVEPTPVAPRKDTRGPLCREACDLCALPAFQAWLGIDTEHHAKLQVLGACGISSRKELDMKTDAARRFQDHIRVPFMKWQRERMAA